MSKKKMPNHAVLENSFQELLSTINSPKPITNFTGNIEQAYLPKMRTDYAPSDESVESATGVDFPVNMPNPAVDPIVSNNISNAEFDYTEDMTLSEGPDSDK